MNVSVFAFGFHFLECFGDFPPSIWSWHPERVSNGLFPQLSHVSFLSTHPSIFAARQYWFCISIDFLQIQSVLCRKHTSYFLCSLSLSMPNSIFPIHFLESLSIPPPHLPFQQCIIAVWSFIDLEAPADTDLASYRY